MLVGMSLGITFIVVCVSPVMVLVMARFVGLQSRTAIYTALLSNSLGETTLTLQVLAYQAGMLGRDSFLVLVMSTMWSMNLCSVGSMKIESLMTKLQPLLGPFLDRPTRAEKEREAARRRKMGGVLRGHVVILGFNETGQEIAEYFREQKKEVCVVDLDPCLHRCFKQAFKGVASKPKPRCPPIDPNKMPATTSKRIQNKFKMITAVRTAARLRATGKLLRGLQGHGAGEGKEQLMVPILNLTLCPIYSGRICVRRHPPRILHPAFILFRVLLHSLPKRSHLTPCMLPDELVRPCAIEIHDYTFSLIRLSAPNFDYKDAVKYFVPGKCFGRNISKRCVYPITRMVRGK